MWVQKYITLYKISTFTVIIHNDDNILCVYKGYVEYNYITFNISYHEMVWSNSGSYWIL